MIKKTQSNFKPMRFLQGGVYKDGLGVAYKDGISVVYKTLNSISKKAYLKFKNFLYFFLKIRAYHVFVGESVAYKTLNSKNFGL